MDTDKMRARFDEIFGPGGEARAFRSPGRVNLIGEHTDYNGGYCFPCALSLGTAALARRRGDKTVKLVSEDYGSCECAIDGFEYEKERGWANYPLGVADEIKKLGRGLSGFEMLIAGDLPVAAGLSSSASVELLTCVALDALFKLGLTTLEMIKLCQRAENNFVGVNCGIMDQFAVAAGKKNSAILLNCRDLSYEYVPLDLNGANVVLGDTKYARGLADSKYNERRAECEKAVECLRGRADIECLSDLTAEQFAEYGSCITDPVIKKRARHVVCENARVLKAAECLKRGDLAAFGALMNESHESLKNDYEVTGEHLDALSDAARATGGCLGSRMTGAGFGGTTVSIVADGAVDDFIRSVSENYTRATGLVPAFYVAEAADGAGVIV